MKVFAVVFIVAPFLGVMALTPAEEIAAKIKSHHEECLKISKLEPALLEKIRTGDIDESNAAIREHVFCYSKKADFCTEAGELKPEVIKAKLSLQTKDKDNVEKTSKTCNATKKSDDIKLYVTQVVACYYKNVPAGVRIM